MTTSVLLYVDFNASSGLGHVSRAEAFFEAISTDQNKVYISSEKDTDRLKPNFNFLKNVTWIDFQEAKQMDFDIAYLDTYSNATINEFKEISAIKKILLIDSNFNDEIPNWANLVIVLEQANVRNSNHKALLVYGLTLIKNRIVRVKIVRQRVYNFDPEYLVGIVNFGGSIQSLDYLLKLKNTFAINNKIKYKVFCESELISTLQLEFSSLSNVTINAIGANYYEQLIMSDFVITAAGTSFLEALYVNIPIVLFNLYDSANSIFSNFRFEQNVLFSGEKEEFSMFSQPEAIVKMEKMNLESVNVLMNTTCTFLEPRDIFISLTNIFN